MLFFELQSKNITEAYNCTLCTGISRVLFEETKIQVVSSVYSFWAGHVLCAPWCLPEHPAQGGLRMLCDAEHAATRPTPRAQHAPERLRQSLS